MFCVHFLFVNRGLVLVSAQLLTKCMGGAIYSFRLIMAHVLLIWLATCGASCVDLSMISENLVSMAAF